MAQFNKPGWLEDWLSQLNWDILGWQIYVGDAIEQGIDWVLDILNTIAEWADLISAWWEDFRQEIIDIFNLIWEVLGTFLEDPVAYLIDIFELYILPWAQEHIPFIATLYYWYLGFKNELELFFENPAGYLQTRFNEDILPWAQEHIPFITTLYHWFMDFKTELEAFFSDPVGYIQAAMPDFTGEVGLFLSNPLSWILQKFEEYVLPWAQEHIPFIATLYFWFTEARDKITNFFTTELWDDFIAFFSNPFSYFANKIEFWFWDDDSE